MPNHPQPLRHRSRLAAAVVLAVTAILVASGSSPLQAAPPEPTTTVSASTNSPLLGENVALTVTFDNTDTTESGFGPYVDLVFDSGGADGDDGVSFVSAAYLGASLAPLAVFDCTGVAQTHPLTGASVACPVGSQIVVLQLPFGSFTPGQPVAPVTVTALVSNLADVSAGLDVTATGGFAFGDSPIGTTPIVGTTATTTLVPEVVRFTKRVVAPEEETATGPNYQARRINRFVDLPELNIKGVGVFKFLLFVSERHTIGLLDDVGSEDDVRVLLFSHSAFCHDN